MPVDFLPGLGKTTISAFISTCRVNLRGREKAAALLASGKPLIFVFWHCHIFFLVHHFRNSGAYPLISLSGDGELIARIAARFGLNPVRGSSSRGGAGAFLKLRKILRECGGPLLITADGPRGPARQVKPGAIQLASGSGAAIVPVSWRASRSWTISRSWDGFRIPRPFTTINCVYGDPLYFQPASGPEALERDCRSLSAVLDQLENELEAC